MARRPQNRHSGLNVRLLKTVKHAEGLPSASSDKFKRLTVASNSLSPNGGSVIFAVINSAHCNVVSCAPGYGEHQPDVTLVKIRGPANIWCLRRESAIYLFRC